MLICDLHRANEHTQRIHTFFVMKYQRKTEMEIHVASVNVAAHSVTESTRATEEKRDKEGENQGHMVSQDEDTQRGKIQSLSSIKLHTQRTYALAGQRV
jgi:hypothetical protein